jgi:hypothetical protein
MANPVGDKLSVRTRHLYSSYSDISATRALMPQGQLSREVEIDIHGLNKGVVKDVIPVIR